MPSAKCLPPRFGQRWQLLLVPPTATFALSLPVQDAEDVQPEVLEKLRTCEAELESMIEAAVENLNFVRECIRMFFWPVHENRLVPVAAGFSFRCCSADRGFSRC